MFQKQSWTIIIIVTDYADSFSLTCLYFSDLIQSSQKNKATLVSWCPGRSSRLLPCGRSFLVSLLSSSPLISCFLSAIHYQTSDKTTKNQTGGDPSTIEQTFIYGQSFYILTRRYANTHVHTWKVVWISPMFKRQAVTAEKWTVITKTLFYCSLQQHLTSPLAWIIRIHLRKVNTIYTQNWFTLAKPERGHKKLTLHSHSAWQLNNTPFSIQGFVMDWWNFQSVREAMYSYHIQHPFYHKTWAKKHTDHKQKRTQLSLKDL